MPTSQKKINFPAKFSLAIAIAIAPICTARPLCTARQRQMHRSSSSTNSFPSTIEYRRTQQYHLVILTATNPNDLLGYRQTPYGKTPSSCLREITDCWIKQCCSDGEETCLHGSTASMCKSGPPLLKHVTRRNVLYTYHVPSSYYSKPRSVTTGFGYIQYTISEHKCRIHLTLVGFLVGLASWPLRHSHLLCAFLINQWLVTSPQFTRFRKHAPPRGW